MGDAATAGRAANTALYAPETATRGHFMLTPCFDVFKTRFCRGVLLGPPGTPYQGGTFVLTLELPNEFPFK